MPPSRPTPINFNAMKKPSGVFSPAVITSKMAMGDLENIQAHHAEIQADLMMHREMVMAQRQEQQVMKNEMDKEKMTADTETKKNALDFQTKQAELSIKAAKT